jgi:hypothetical protein
MSAARKRAEPMHVALPGALSEEIRQAAKRRGDAPTSLAAAILFRVFGERKVEDLLRQTAADQIAPGQARDAGGLTKLQRGVVYMIGLHAEADGYCRLSPDSLSYLLSMSSGTVLHGVLASLERKRIVQRGQRSTSGRATPWGLTDAGKSIFRTLAGTEAEGGEA